CRSQWFPTPHRPDARVRFAGDVTCRSDARANDYRWSHWLTELQAVFKIRSFFGNGDANEKVQHHVDRLFIFRAHCGRGFRISGKDADSAAYARHGRCHLAAGKNAAGGRDDTPDFYGLVTAICVAPLNGAARPDAPAPRETPIAKKPIWSRYRPLMISTGWELRARRAGF